MIDDLKISLSATFCDKCNTFIFGKDRLRCCDKETIRLYCIDEGIVGKYLLDKLNGAKNADQTR
jgi:hypothetical protein